MTRAFSVPYARAIRIAVAVLALVALTTLAYRATAAPSKSDPGSRIAVSLDASAPATPVDGTMGYTGVVRLQDEASSLSARLQVRSPGGRLIYQRTQYVQDAKPGAASFPFSRQLSALSLEPGTYPVTLSVHASIAGSQVSTEVAGVLRVYDPADKPVPTVLLAKVHAAPLAGVDGRMATDPATATATRARDQIDEIAQLVNADASARVTLSVPPITIEEWRRIASSGYTLTSGTVVPPSSDIAAQYAVSLTHLQQALATGRLELVTMGYSDPSLADLSANKLNGDAAVQYDAGLSATFASLEATPSQGTAPAGGSVPKAMQHALVARGVAYTFADADSTRIGKRTGIASGVYPCADSTMTALVVDARASRGLESGDASATLAHTFDRMGTSLASQPVVLRIDLDDTVADATATVAASVNVLETTPWVTLKLGREVRPPKNARAVTFVVTPTKNAPVEFWPRVRSSRTHANAMIAALSLSDDSANVAQTDSLIAECSAWSAPAAQWAGASRGMAFANTALKISNAVLDQIGLSATSVTLSGATGNVPINVQNGTRKTLLVLVRAKTTTGVSVVGTSTVPTTLPPGETFVQLPIDMSGAISGKLTVEVLAGNIVLARRTVDVHRSYLDRLALIGGIVLVLGGLLVWIVQRVRRAPDIVDDDSAFADDDAPHDGPEPRYTEARSEAPDESDTQ